MVHNEIHTIDLLIIAAYLIAMVLIGLVVVRKVRNMDDYYLGGRSFGPLVLMATVCATIIGGSGLMGRAGVAYSSGFKAIMTALPYLLGTFPRMRKSLLAVTAKKRLSKHCFPLCRKKNETSMPEASITKPKST